MQLVRVSAALLLWEEEMNRTQQKLFDELHKEITTTTFMAFIGLGIKPPVYKRCRSKAQLTQELHDMVYCMRDVSKICLTLVDMPEEP